MRRSFYIGQYLQGLLPYCVHLVEKFDSPIGEVVLELVDRNRQQSKTLTNVFVKVFRDPVTFPFFCLDHSAVHAGKGLFRPLALGDVTGDARTAHNSAT